MTDLNTYLEALMELGRDPHPDQQVFLEAYLALPKLIAIAEAQSRALERYAGHSLTVVEGRCRLNFTPAEDSPGMPFHEGETWLLGDHATEALAEVRRLIEGEGK